MQYLSYAKMIIVYCKSLIPFVLLSEAFGWVRLMPFADGRLATTSF